MEVIQDLECQAAFLVPVLLGGVPQLSDGSFSEDQQVFCEVYRKESTRVVWLGVVL